MLGDGLSMHCCMLGDEMSMHYRMLRVGSPHTVACWEVGSLSPIARLELRGSPRAIVGSKMGEPQQPG